MWRKSHVCDFASMSLPFKECFPFPLPVLEYFGELMCLVQSATAHHDLKRNRPASSDETCKDRRNWQSDGGGGSVLPASTSLSHLAYIFQDECSVCPPTCRGCRGEHGIIAGGQPHLSTFSAPTFSVEHSCWREYSHCDSVTLCWCSSAIRHYYRLPATEAVSRWL